MQRPDDLAARLAGHDVVHVPLIETEPLGDEPIDVDGYDWLIVTSITAARELRRRMRGRPARVAAIGAATAEAMGGADLVPAVSTQEGLLAELPRPLGLALFAGAEDARRLLVEELDADFVPLYRTRRLAPAAFPDADLVVLASASAAEAYGALGKDVPAVSIGPQTTAAARAVGVRILAEARTHDVDGLAEAIWSLRF
jgi:uroporphyrinogen-III synthase